MAPSRGKGKTKAKSANVSTARSGRRNTRSHTAAKDDISDVYQSLLDAVSDADDGESDRPLKRRKTTNARDTGPQHVAEAQIATRNGHEATPPTSPFSGLQPTSDRLQTVEDSSEDDDSDLEFEDVLAGPATRSSPDAFDNIQDVSISLHAEPSTNVAATSRRKPATHAEKAHRLLVHKLHVACLLGHCMYVNGRCNDAVVHRHVGELLSSKTLSYLKPKADSSQFQRDRSFMDGLQQAMQTFNAEYRIVGGGMMRPQWIVDGQESRSYDQPPPMDRSDFVSAAKNMEGSQDTGNQLFCALLRSAGVDVRLVCSFQVLPFTSVPKASTPKKPIKETIFAMTSETASKNLESDDDHAVSASKSIGKVPAVRRRLGQPSFNTEPAQPTQTTPAKKSKPTPKLAYPVFWVEAFNEAQQKWIPVDSAVTRTINKAGKLEPPASYDLNHMTYVIAFEDDGVARDVTKRYAKAYNAKTRRHRVEASTDGAKWMKKAMRIFRRRGGALDRDQVEDAELAQKEAKEGMPGNVLDFKDHPYYALERHLKRHEVIHPKRQAGKVNAGTAAKPKLEPVFRRQDVFACKSADKWYRVGREIKVGEQPLKHIAATARRQHLIEEENDGELPAATALYAPYQTQMYVPPPVQRGRIPKNVYGNLDVYVPSMVPPGGVHIRHRLAQQAAKLLRVDFADAVTGFKFQGRHGTAVVDGCVVAQQYGDAIWAVVEGFEEQIEEDESRARSLEALRLWKKFLTGLKIRERVKAYGDGSMETPADAAEPNGSGSLSSWEKPLVTAGRFTLWELTSINNKPKKRKLDKDDYDHDDEVTTYDGDHEDMDIDEIGGGFLPTDSVMNPVEDGGGGFFVEDESPGGFVADNPEDGGGYLHEDDPADIQGGRPASGMSGGFVVHNLPGDDELSEDSPENQQSPSVELSRERTGSVDLVRESAVTSRPDAEQFTAALDADVSPAPDQEQFLEPQPSIKEDVAPVVRDDSSSQASSQGNDQDSILSHDPDDDDAEPDWLESD